MILGLKSLLREYGDKYSIAGSSCFIDSAIKEIPLDKPDVLILDLYIRKLDPLVNIRKLKQNFPTLPIIIHTFETCFSRKLQMFREGIRAWVSKDEDLQAIVRAIDEVSSGASVIPYDVGRILSRDKEGNEEIQLTSDELNILGLLSSGKCCKEIAVDLCKSISSVEKSLQRIREKLGAKSNEELIFRLLQKQYQ